MPPAPRVGCAGPEGRLGHRSCLMALQVPTGKYLLMHNGGGRSYTMDFLVRRKRPGDVILGLGDKPKNWADCQDMAWERPEGGDYETIPDIPALFN